MEVDEQPATAAAAGDATERRERRKKKSRWGKETEVGEKLLAGADIEEVAPAAAPPAPAAPPSTDAQAEPVPAAEQPAAEEEAGEPARKKRRSRWEPGSEQKPAAMLPGLQIALPASIAALVDIHVDPAVLELQRQLNAVSDCGPALSWM